MQFLLARLQYVVVLLVEPQYALAQLLELLGVAPQLARQRYAVVPLVELQYALAPLLMPLGVALQLAQLRYALVLLLGPLGVLPQL